MKSFAGVGSRRSRVVPTVVALLAMLVMAVVAACENGGARKATVAPAEAPAPPPAVARATEPPVAAEPTTEPAEVAVEIADFFGQPIAAVSHAEPSLVDLELSQKTIFAAVGARITWTNDDSVTHNLQALSGQFDENLAPGDSFEWQPDTPGAIRYICTIHDNVHGVVVVPVASAVAPDYYDGRSISGYFADTCGGCHGPNREGGTGPALLPGRLGSDDQFYFDAIMDGRENTIMPAWGNLGLSPEETWGLIAFIRSEPDAAVVEWDIDEIAASLVVLVADEDLVDEPQLDANIDNMLLVTERENRSIALLDGDTHTLVKHIDASYRAHGYVFDPTSDRWVHNLGRDGWVFKIDLYTGVAVRMVRVGHDSRGLAISDDGKYLIAGNYIPNSAVILDAGTLEPLKVIETSGVDPDGNMVDSRVAITSDVSPELVGPYFLIALKEAGQVWRIDYSDPDFPIVKVANVGRILHDGFLRADNKMFYIASQTDNWMAVIDVESMEIVEMIGTGNTPHPGSGAVWEADGRQYGATVHAGEGLVTIWDLETNEIVGTVPTAGPGLFVRSHDHSPYVWADALFAQPQTTITVFEKEAPFEIVGVIDDGVMTLHPEFTADGKFVYVSDWNGAMVRVYDAVTLELVAEIEGVITPTGIFSVERRLETLGH